MYDNHQDANRYLANTVCYWDGVPIYVAECRAGRNDRNIIEAYAYKLPYGFHDGEYFNIGDERFNAFKYKLGYINTGNGVVYMARRPARIQSQGLCANNVNIRGMSVGAGGARYRDDFNDLVRGDGFKDMLLGKYPSMAEARKILLEKPNIRAVAFSREFAIKRHPQFKNLFFLSYKGEDISYSETSEFSLPEEYKYLKEISTQKGCLKAG